jgi:1-acyl-sn-glycerol-3-phosphate acyltransferase
VAPATPHLSPFEEAALTLGRLTNERAGFKRLQSLFLHGISRTWVRAVVQRRAYIDGVDWLVDHVPDRGVVLASNHRSFFDQYIAMLSLYESGVSFPRRIYFPVRADYFYDHPGGVLLNYAIGGGAMYPPIYRDRPRRALNQDAVDRLVGFLSRPDVMVGMHPEGRRNKEPDPYGMLRAQPGIGEVILRARPLVVPLFIGGLTNDFLGQARLNFHPEARRLQPLILAFGQPVDYEEFTHQEPRLTLYKRVADRVRDEILALGERVRDLHEAAVRGDLDDRDPGWLTERIRRRRRARPWWPRG